MSTMYSRRNTPIQRKIVKNTQKRNTQIRNTQNRNTQNRNTQNRNTQIRNIQNYNFQELKNKGVFITTITNKGMKFLPNIIHNFLRQKYPHKTLCIIFNCVIDIDKVQKILNEKKIQYIIDSKPELTQWACNKYSVSKMKETDMVWCKMDDDDYYGPSYVLINLQYMIHYKALIVGRDEYYVYIPEIDTLYYKKGRQGKVSQIAGPTIFVHKYIFTKISFDNVPSMGDTMFQKKCRNLRIPIYSVPNYDFIYIRRINGSSHTWKIDTKKYVENMKRVPSSSFKDKHKHIFNLT